MKSITIPPTPGGATVRLVQVKPQQTGDPVVVERSLSISWSEWAQLALDGYAPLGRGLKQIRQAVKLAERISASNGILELEDADFDVVKAAVDAFEWSPGSARKLVAYYEVIESAAVGTGAGG